MTEAPQTESPLQILHQSRVEESEIDALGHLSVPFYQQRALAASHALLTDLGLDTPALQDQGIEWTLVDTFMRNYREQFLGASVMVQGGVLGAEDNRIRLYQELVNPERGELSATFVHKLELQETESRRPAAIETPVLKRVTSARVAWPEHGRSRSLDLSRPPFQLPLAEAVRRDLATTEPREIQADECNPAGVLEPERFQHLEYSSTPLKDLSTQWVFESPDGRRLGLADLESRSTLFVLPQAGAKIQVFSAEVQIARKTFRRSHWVFNLDSRELLTAGSVVMALLDLEARRAIEISAELKESVAKRYHPDLC